MNQNLMTTTGETLFDCISRAIADGDLPAGSSLGDLAKTRQGWFPKPASAIGTVGSPWSGEYYWVLSPTS